MPPKSPLAEERTGLHADCTRCTGLCCVAPAFVRSAEFAIDKPAGVACPHLDGADRCSVHDRLRPLGFVGCSTYDCFGAGQRVSAEFAGQSWRESPQLAQQQFATFAVVRELHEMRWYLAEAVELAPADVSLAQLRAAARRPDELAGLPAADLVATDLDPIRTEVGRLLRSTSAAVRKRARESARTRSVIDGVAGARTHVAVGPGVNLTGRDLRGLELIGADLSGARLLGADLRRASLQTCDLRGADLRGADLRGADLSGCLFLTQPQVDAARGGEGTGLPETIRHPRHWSRTPAGSPG